MIQDTDMNADFHNGPNLGLEPSGRQPMNDNDIKLPPLPEWMSNYTIPADGFECGEQVMLIDRMHAYARAAVLSDREARQQDAEDAARWRHVERIAKKETAHDRYGDGAHWSVVLFSDDSRQTFGEAVDAAMQRTTAREGER